MVPRKWNPGRILRKTGNKFLPGFHFQGVALKRGTKYFSVGTYPLGYVPTREFQEIHWSEDLKDIRQKRL